MSKIKPKKWTEVYYGDDEFKLFKALARHVKYDWRSVAALVKESGLSPKRVEEILTKYQKKGIVYRSPKNEDNWAYWERVPQLLSEKEDSISQIDQRSRLKKFFKNP